MSTRRESLIALALAPLWAALPARAQQADKPRRIGYLDAAPANDPDSAMRREAFSQGLRELGWVPGRNIEIEYRSASGEPDQFV